MTPVRRFGAFDRLPVLPDQRRIPAPPRWFAVGLLSIVVAGIVVRIAFTAVWMYGKPLSGDPAFFQETAAQLARGNGYVIPFLGSGSPVPTALHPPMFPIVLAVLDLIGLGSSDAHRIALAFVAGGGLVAMAYLGRRLGGPAVGLIAAGIAALSPVWVQPTGKVLSESLYLVVVPVVLLAALRCIERPSPSRFAVLGLAIGAATVTRSEALLFAVLLGIPLLVFATRVWTERVWLALVLVAGFAVVVGPWLIRNDVQLGAWTLSTDGGTTLVGANSSTTYAPSSQRYGSFDQTTQWATAAAIKIWELPPDHARHWTELTLNNELGRTGRTYAKRHIGDVPGVVLAREGRMLGVYRSGSELQFDVASDSDGVWVAQVGAQYLNWILYPFMAVGAVVLYRWSRRDLVIMVMPIGAAVLTAALAFGSTRYRAVAEPSYALLAAIGAFRLVQYLWHGRVIGAGAVRGEAIAEDAAAEDGVAADLDGRLPEVRTASAASSDRPG